MTPQILQKTLSLTTNPTDCNQKLSEKKFWRFVRLKINIMKQTDLTRDFKISNRRSV